MKVVSFAKKPPWSCSESQHDSTLSQTAVNPLHRLKYHGSFGHHWLLFTQNITEQVGYSWNLRSSWSYAEMIGHFCRRIGIFCRSNLQGSLLEPWRIDRYGVLKRGCVNTSQLCVTSRKMKDPIHTTEEAWNYGELKLSCVFLLFGGAPFEYWAEHRQFRLRLTVGLLSTFKQITQQPHNFAFYLIRYHPILKHVTKW
jgi:hypothetical protein